MKTKVRRNIDLIAKHGLGLLRKAKLTASADPTDPDPTAPSQPSQPVMPKPPRARRPRLPDLSELPQLPQLPQLPEMASDIRSIRRRSAIVGGLVIAGLLGMGWRSWNIAVEHHAEYAAQGNRQQLRTYTLAASRGNVVDRNHISLAVNDRLERIVMNPRLIRAYDKQDKVLEFLLTMFGPEHADYIVSELERDKAYRKLKLPLDEDKVAAVRAAKLPGIRLEQDPHRVYPRGSLAAHVLGRVNAQGQGNLGVELGLNDDLAGRAASSPAYYAAFGGVGHKLLVDGHPDHGISRGHTVVLTIDSAIQAMAEQEIDTLVRNWHPVGASVIVLDPSSGQILALANRPTFDPNHPVASTSQTVNLAVQHAYEPGSTLKAITVAAALEQGTIRADQTFFCEEGRWQYTPRHAIRDTKNKGWLDVTDILAVSSNICTTKIYETLGKESLYRWIRRFHFGDRPEIQLPAVSPGMVADWRKWSDIQAANVSFGQGMSASPLQVAAAFAALANGGVYRTPTLVAQVLDADSEVVWDHEIDGVEGERIVRKATADTVLEMLTAVVETREGTGKKAKIEGYEVAGKTSTAQKANPQGGYFEDQYYASFVGAVPANGPKLVILVSVDNPEGGHYGNEVAAPTFARLGARVLAYMGVPGKDGTLPVPDAIALAEDAPALVEGFIPDLDVQPALPGRRAVEFTTGLPDFTGLTLAQALAEAEKAHVELQASGSGLAVGQSVPPGPVQAGAEVIVHFQPL
ncbi:penicillin-binding protein [Enhygromyxa salina]|uniref:Stage V sporulation protein D n=1 Tax=Enhygromyxa salina TaxID=215803 RepID=A0A2S9XTT7_9BACT|nr:penicillin-binding protein [Enhygromyxa salina]PRP96140.1 Stage V sporulation protein D [Enhygromyxa salina]